MTRYVRAAMTAPRVARTRIPAGPAGTARTAAQIGRLIREGAADFYVRQHAIDVLMQRGVRPKDYLGEIKALFEWVQREVRYTKDPFRVEVLHSARRMIELRAGDCDDMAILLGAMVRSIGHAVRLVLTGPNPLKPVLFSHVYIEAHFRGHWIPLDATMSHPMGWAPTAPVRRVLPVDESALRAGSRPYRRFTGVAPRRLLRARHERLMPHVTVDLGQLAGLMYRSDKWQPGRARTYVHFFGQPPRLVGNVAGDRLYIVGGRYRVTARGIEG